MLSCTRWGIDPLSLACSTERTRIKGAFKPGLTAPPAPEPGALLFLKDFEGSFELGILREDLFPGRVFILIRGAHLLAIFELHLDVRCYARTPNKVPVGGQPLGDAEKDGRAIAQGVLREHGPGAEGRLADDLGPAIIPKCPG